ncbi:hypothetical protein AX15_004616 [Amanita polypyramis BW_CC]|nr:hypothetical protein AX15_004616 [Amanita polypyramis BW_CC]
MVHSPLVWDVLLFATLFGLHFLALFVKPSPYRPLIFLPISAIVTYLMHSTNRGDSSPQRASTIASVALPILFSASDSILLTDVQKKLRRKGQKYPADRMEWRARLRWAFSLLSSPRGVGWEHESSHAILPLPPSVRASRWAFVKAQALRLVAYAALLDILRWHDRWNPCYAKNGPSITAFGWTWRCFSMFSWPIQTYIQIDRLYWALASISVLLGLSTPGEWPLFFGDLFDAYTVQRFWGRTWHQLLRRMLTSHAKWVAQDVLRLKPGTWRALCIQLFTGFFVSGLIHGGIDYALYGRRAFCHMTGSWGRSSPGIDGGGGGAMSFFLLQPVAIIVENVVIQCANTFPVIVRSRSRWRRWWHLLGYLWVLAWFTYCMPMWLDPLIRSGMVESNSGHWIDRRNLFLWLV